MHEVEIETRTRKRWFSRRRSEWRALATNRDMWTEASPWTDDESAAERSFEFLNSPSIDMVRQSAEQQHNTLTHALGEHRAEISQMQREHHIAVKQAILETKVFYLELIDKLRDDHRTAIETAAMPRKYDWIPNEHVFRIAGTSIDVSVNGGGWYTATDYSADGGVKKSRSLGDIVQWVNEQQLQTPEA